MPVNSACLGGEAAANASLQKAEGQVDILEIGEDSIVEAADGTERRQRHKSRGTRGTERRRCHGGLVDPVAMEIVECQKGHVHDDAG